MPGRLHGRARSRAAAHGSDELRERFLPPLLETDYDRCQRGAQFLTEVQGGSDVGANTTRGDPGRRRLAAARREVVLLGRRRRPVRRHRAAARRARRARAGSAASSCRARRRRAERLHDPPAEGQARDARAGDRARSTFDGALAYPIGAARGRLPDRRRRRAQHVALAERVRLGRADAPRVPRGGELRARPRGVRPPDRRVPARPREPGGDEGGGGRRRSPRRSS